ncbi:MAG: hypothetical protein M3Y93_10380 [Pseudomonadota bacterium]|nr:hypothetical protein [Pseudomonadota bacterium]
MHFLCIDHARRHGLHDLVFSLIAALLIASAVQTARRQSGGRAACTA